MHSASHTAFLLSLIAPLFSHLKVEDYAYVLENDAWRQVRDAVGRPGSPLHEALELPSWEVRSSFQDELLVSGMPFAAMPVESLHRPWSLQAGNAYGATRGLYLGDAARHVSDVYGALAIEVPSAFAAMPDHLTLELELLALLLVAGNERAARDFTADHLDWLDDYDAALAERAKRAARSENLAPERRVGIDRGAAFLRALVGALAVILGAGAEPAAAPSAPSLAALRQDDGAALLGMSR